MRVLVVGGSDAGIEAARRCLELDRSVEVSVLVADATPISASAAFRTTSQVMSRTGDTVDNGSTQIRITRPLDKAHTIDLLCCPLHCI